MLCPWPGDMCAGTKHWLIFVNVLFLILELTACKTSSTCFQSQVPGAYDNVSDKIAAEQLRLLDF